MSESDIGLDLNDSDMMKFWAEGFISNPILKFRPEKAQKTAQDMLNHWLMVGLSFEELKRDFIDSNGCNSCPVNTRTGKDWEEILSERVSTLENLHSQVKNIIFPTALIRSTIKYFMSKGPALTKGSILNEETERLRIGDAK